MRVNVTGINDQPDRAEFYLKDPNLLPVMNWRPNIAREALAEEAYRPPVPQVADVEGLVDYTITLTCSGCRYTIEPNVPKLMLAAGRVSFEHLVTVLSCERCHAPIEKLEITRVRDRGLANPPRQIFEAPMCRRFKFAKSVDEVRSLFRFTNTPNLRPRYNIATAQMVPVVAQSGDERLLGEMKWGFIPNWATDEKIGAGMVNARIESVATSKAYRKAFEKHHCLVLADAFFEWEHIDGGKIKQPWCFTLPDGGAFAFAGLWEKWKSPAGEMVTSCTIITQEPYPAVKPIHDRSPVILAPEAFDDWLACKRTDAAGTLGVPVYRGPLKAFRVSREMGNAKNEGPEFAQPIDEEVRVA